MLDIRQIISLSFMLMFVIGVIGIIAYFDEGEARITAATVASIQERCTGLENVPNDFCEGDYLIKYSCIESELIEEKTFCEFGCENDYCVNSE